MDGGRGRGAEDRPVTVTLLTGDRVTLHDGRTSVRPGAGRSNTRFLTSRSDGKVSVVPHDALPLLRDGKLDPRLFDVTELVRSGYDDAARTNLPLLLTYARDGDRRAASAIEGARVTAELATIGGAAVEVSKARAGEVWAAVTGSRAGARATTAGGIEKIWLDGRRDLLLEHSVPQIGVPAAHQAGYTGRGVRVAVLDSGVDGGHPDLTVAEARNFTEEPDPRDTVGHGTHVASIIAGSGAASGGRYRGVAPDATLLSGKVCTDFCQESAILAGMHWAAVEMRADVVNLSLGRTDTPGVDPLEEAVDTLTAQTGTLFVVAAGNDHPFLLPVSSPSTADAALSVGAVDGGDRLADFSSRGPRVGDGGIKPDLTAPGVDIAAARADGTLLGIPLPGDKYVRASGTSMASPHVAGAVALLAQQHPDWTAEQLKGALMGAAAPQPGQPIFAQGAGRVDAARAVRQAVVSEPASVTFGETSWPHHDDEPIRRTVAYRNLGTAALTLELTAEVTGPDDRPAPAGMFRLATDRVTVPAGGRAEVEITVDTSVDGPDGVFSGRLVARGGSTVLTTPVSVTKEVESYTVRLSHLDRTGAATGSHSTTLVRLADGGAVVDVPDPDGDGTAEVRLPKGRYGLHGMVWEADDFTFTQLVDPELVVAADTTVTLDARRGGPVQVTVPEPSAVSVMAETTAIFRTDQRTYGFVVGGDSYAGHFVGQLGPAVSADRFVSWVDSQWVDPDEPTSPYLYVLSETIAGRLPDGFTRHYRRGELASVTHQFRPGSGSAAERVVFPAKDGASGFGLSVPVPGQRVEYYNTNESGRVSEIFLGEPTEEGWLDVRTLLESRPETYQAGRRYHVVWGAAPYGPSLATRWPVQGIVRRGDRIQVEVPLHSDAAGHPGTSRVDSARTALYRDGALVGEYTGAAPGYGEFLVPSGTARYLLEVSAKRSFTDLSTEVSAAWSFSSGPAGGEGYSKLPAAAVRFLPVLDAGYAAPGGRDFEIPLRVEFQPGAPKVAVQRLTVEISYDGGKSWRSSALRRAGEAWVATVSHPAGAGHASLRATAVDSGGNSVTQTIIQAYRLR
ncbi:S8 family serine peptidase [Micromonosporaceae bacterium B7E4]